MSDTIFKSSIWLKSLDEKSQYSQEFKDEVEILRSSFKQVRIKANIISNFICQSQPSLTLHDTSHLDSLWETANIIAGDDLNLNPIEAYIFGCSVLFHDLGMALILWDEDLEKIKLSFEFRDLIFKLYKYELKRNPTPDELDNVPQAIVDTAINNRLRDLHSLKAKSLPLKSVEFKGDKVYLIESSDLRQKLGDKIGMIAESHWWYIDEIRTNFGRNVKSPAPTSFPIEWTINNVKLACLLRLADFIHIDDRRAPSIQYSLLKPKGVSNDHWNFQNKLNRALYENERISFASHTKFNYEDSEAWWLAYRTIIDIDKEIKSVDNLLIDLNITRFQAKGVKGIESPILCSEFIQTEGWEPADTQFKISDFPKLIEKMGGKQLYGNRPYVPLRELIQNSCDALSAKKHYSTNFSGEILINYYTDDSKNEWLEVTDNGIGMSKSTLLYGLLDFGNSYWKSNLSLKEHAGLLSSGFAPIGNFGIGFFSIFMISDFVQIITKPITENSKTIVLEFNKGLSFNPILRNAHNNEKRIESGTTIRLILNSKNLIKKIYKSVAELSDVEVDDPLAYSCRKIAPALSHKLITCYNNGPKEIINSGDDWKEMDSLTLLKRISGFASNEQTGWNIKRLNYISEFLRPIINKKNEIIARATILKQLPSNNDYSGHGVVTVGGLKQSKIYRFPGIWVGSNEVVTRNHATPICSYEELKPWLQEQYELVVNSNKLNENEKVDVAKVFYSLGLPCKKLPIANTSEGWKTYEDISKMDHGDHVLLRFVLKEYEDTGSILPKIICSQMGNTVVGVEANNVFHNEQLWDDELLKIDKEFDTDNNDNLNNRSMLSFTIKAICESWGVEVKDALNESMINMSEWKPIIDVYKNKFGENIKEPVFVIANPRLTTKRKLYKKYESEIKRWIGYTDKEGFDIDDLLD